VKGKSKEFNICVRFRGELDVCVGGLIEMEGAGEV
jgi:hypothetical protein